MDLNGDGIDDVISGDYAGKVNFFEGTEEGWKKSVVIPEKNSFPMATASFVDWDGDGDYDMITGDVSGNVYVNVNEGTKDQFKFGSRVPLRVDGKGMKVCQKSTPLPVDWDGDGILDILVGDEAALVSFFKGKKDRTYEEPVSLLDGKPLPKGGYFEIKEKIKGRKTIPGYRVRLGVTDWNNDGLLDLLVGNCSEKKDEEGLYLFLRRSSGTESKSGDGKDRRSSS